MPKKPIPTFNIEGASGGNQQLRNVLNQIVTAVTQQQKATGTGSVRSPSQQAATVTFENPLFIVTFTGQAPASTQQAAQQATIGSAGGGVLYNQVRAATSLLFDAGGNVTLYGGDNGAAQSEFVIAGLDATKAWYFQVRSSYDGNTWNPWKTLNGGKPVNGNANAVSFQPVINGGYAMFLMPGSTAAGFGVVSAFDQLAVAPGPGTTIENAIGIAAPTSYQDAGYQAAGLNAGISADGVVTQEYVDTGSDEWPGTASCLLFAWGSSGQTPLKVSVTGGTWYVFTLPGGNLLALGCGTVANGAAVDLPAGLSNANAMGVVSPASQSGATEPAQGVNTASMTPSGGTAQLTVNFEWGNASSGPTTWGGNGQWFAVAWTPALQPAVVSVAGGQFLIVQTPSGPLAIGMGTCSSGATIPLPDGYEWLDPNDATQAIGWCTPISTAGAGDYALHGVELCAVNANGQTILVYSDGEGHQWGGNVAWVAIAWQNPQG